MNLAMALLFAPYFLIQIQPIVVLDGNAVLEVRQDKIYNYLEVRRLEESPTEVQKLEIMGACFQGRKECEVYRFSLYTSLNSPQGLVFYTCSTYKRLKPGSILPEECGRISGSLIYTHVSEAGESQPLYVWDPSMSGLRARVTDLMDYDFLVYLACTENGEIPKLQKKGIQEILEDMPIQAWVNRSSRLVAKTH